MSVLCFWLAVAPLTLSGTAPPASYPLTRVLKRVDGATRWWLVLGDLEFPSPEAVLEHAAHFPPGTEIVWNPGCVTESSMPLRTPESLERFRRQLAAHRLVFRIVPSG